MNRVVRCCQTDGSLSITGRHHRKQQKLVVVTQDVRVAAIFPSGRIAHRPFRCGKDRIFRTPFPVIQILAGRQTDALFAKIAIVEPGIYHIIGPFVLQDRGSRYDLSFPRSGNNGHHTRMVLPMHQIGRSCMPKRLFTVRFLPILRIVGFSHIIKQMECPSLFKDEIILHILPFTRKFTDLSGILGYLLRAPCFKRSSDQTSYSDQQSTQPFYTVIFTHSQIIKH